MKDEGIGASSVSFERLRKEAKRWLKALRQGDRHAIERFERGLPRHSARPGLREVQQALARERGHASWAALKSSLASATAPKDLVALADDFLSLACLSYKEDWPSGPSKDITRGKWTRAELLRARHPEVATATFHAAVVCGELDHVTRALEREPEVAKQPGGPQAWEPLLLLCYSRLPYAPAIERALAMAELLLDHGADPNAHWFWEGGTEYRFTALTGAMGQGEKGEPEHPRADELAQLLLKRGADPNDSQGIYNTHLVDDDTRWLQFLGNYGFSTQPEHQKNLSYLIAQATHNGHVKRLAWLLTHGADPNAKSVYTGHSCYQLALMHGDPELREVLRQYGATPVELSGQDAFVAAVARGDEAEARRLLQGHPEFLEKVDPLIEAAGGNRLQIVRSLLALGMDPNREGRHGHRALNVACEHRQVVDVLLAHGADPRARCFGGTVAYWAHLAKNEEMARYHAEHSRTLLDALVSGHVELARELLKEEPARATEQHPPPLHALPDELDAAEVLIELLLEHGADPRAKNTEGLTALESYEARGSHDLADLLESALEARP